MMTMIWRNTCLYVNKNCEIYDLHCVYAACKGQVGNEWHYMRSFAITSTLCHAILPCTDDGLSEHGL